MEDISCVLCRDSELIHFKNGDYHLNLAPPLEIRQCSHCGLLFMSPRPDEKLRTALFSGVVPEELKLYSTVNANYGSVTDTRHKLFNERIEKLINETGRKPQEISLLDVGASSGTFVEIAKKKGIKANGVEPSADGIKAASIRGIDLIQSEAEKLPFPDNSFDIVHSHHVFEHLSDPLKAASEILRVLKPGGFVFIEVPNQLDNIRFFRDRLFGRIHKRQRNIRSIHHLFFFSKLTMEGLLKKADFCKIAVTSKYSIKPKGIRAWGGYLTMLAGWFYLGGELIQARGYKLGQ